MTPDRLGQFLALGIGDPAIVLSPQDADRAIHLVANTLNLIRELLVHLRDPSILGRLADWSKPWGAVNFDRPVRKRVVCRSLPICRRTRAAVSAGPVDQKAQIGRAQGFQGRGCVKAQGHFARTGPCARHG
ncbi:MAG: hypothetical protein WAT25_08615, partial [Paracoccaceae bacterium]